MRDGDDAVVCGRGLHKGFGKVHALRGVDLSVPAGTVYGLLGPNGAGKTTIVRILTTLLRPDAGTATIAGHDVVTEANAVRYRIGLAGQHAAVDEELTGTDNLRMFGRLYHLSGRQARRRADELLDQFGLTGAAGRVVGTYSGGMRRRLDIAASLLVMPPVLFLDEPTTGLDPRSRNEVWASVRGLVAAGTTVLLTTQYLDEADQLADEIAVIDRGSVIASGTPAQLKTEVGGDRIEVVVTDAGSLTSAAAALARVADHEPRLEPASLRLSVPVADGSHALVAAVRALDAAGVGTVDIGLRHSTLDDVFLRLTGHATTETIDTTERKAA